MDLMATREINSRLPAKESIAWLPFAIPIAFFVSTTSKNSTTNTEFIQLIFYCKIRFL